MQLGGDRVVTLNAGLGRDSVTMLCLLLEGTLRAEGVQVSLSDVTAVVFADTGMEWDFTYQVLPRVAELCRQSGLRFLALKKPPEHGARGWGAHLAATAEERTGGAGGVRRGHDPLPWVHTTATTIEERAASGHYHRRAPILNDYLSRQTVVSVAKGDCSANHKILPIRRLIEDLATEQFGVETNADWGRLVRAGARRPHLTLIGYAADEPDRYQATHCSPWYISEAYPLVELGISKAHEAVVLSRWHFGGVKKSGCYMCPHQPVSWYWALSEVDPAAFERVAEYESVALRSNPRMTVKGSKRTLREAVAKWRAENPAATVQSVLEKNYDRCHHSAAIAEESRSFAARAEVEDRQDTELLLEVQMRVLLRVYGSALKEQYR